MGRRKHILTTSTKSTDLTDHLSRRSHLKWTKLRRIISTLPFKRVNQIAAKQVARSVANTINGNDEATVGESRISLGFTSHKYITCQLFFLFQTKGNDTPNLYHNTEYGLGTGFPNISHHPHQYSVSNNECLQCSNTRSKGQKSSGGPRISLFNTRRTNIIKRLCFQRDDKVVENLTSRSYARMDERLEIPSVDDFNWLLPSERMVVSSSLQQPT